MAPARYPSIANLLGGVNFKGEATNPVGFSSVGLGPILLLDKRWLKRGTERFC